ncbi:hypothetical protein TMatcc_008646 [Talaromyces marneffei ATCC 18224]|uniref:Uncharacterized protein n=2 Tax=Talaromyces marneffei TaxID=37727 RepID=B6QLE9_TALMQ|nr:uncharacterized protein EYB26_007975 [Talaromyces marneffei]EEA21926.1 conserved hypothetical protein [Talaromyces marneffei ATCC 18224]KAE8550603.1 hypothetical protein EYB25_006831 [Talaromyces marneffei]QGA20273.1 hypothetical protein EYB26_007975 [Talaromyces marneffei]
MANIVNSSLGIIRRHKTRRPRLHSRWGDVTITPPVEGAWSQFENPYLRDDEEYGPGFVPSIDIGNKEVLLLDSASDSSDDESTTKEKRGMKEERTEKEVDSKAMSKARRLTRILLPSSVDSPVRKTSVDKSKVTDFRYRPVQPDYAQEVAEKIDKQSRPHFRYVPASKHYMQELKIADIRLSDDDISYCQNDSEDDADDEYEANSIKSRSERQQRLRSHSCDPDIGGRSPVATTTRRKPHSQRGTPLETIHSPTSTLSDAMSSATLTRPAGPRANSTSRLGEQEPSPRFYAIRPDKKPQVITVKRSQSATPKLRRRTMTLEMVRDQDDLWY